MRRRTGSKVKFDVKIMQDVGMASLATRILPILVNYLLPLNPTLYIAVGAGGGYLAGTVLKNNTLANASIALGLVEFIAPMIEDLVGGLKPGNGIPQGAPPPEMIGAVRQEPVHSVADYISLNDYVPAPSNRIYDDYAGSY